MSRTEIARSLRSDSTDAERAIWRLLRNRRLAKYKFRRQQAIGPFVVDFYCHSERLVIELDGGHHSEQEESDQRRTRWLEERGYNVLRFWNNDVLKNPEGVLQSILGNLERPSSSPLF